jgi:hypothetical protein
MTLEVTICKYGCNTQLPSFDTSANKYKENDGTMHTRERCQELKQKLSSVPNGGNENDISVDLLLKKLESIGVRIDLNKLRNTVNGNRK